MQTLPSKKPVFSKRILSSLAAGALVFAGSSPALANDRDERDGVDAGDVIAGALVIGGIAALAGAFDGDDDRAHRRDFRRGHRGEFRGGVGNRRFARGGANRVVNRCVRAAERQARRFGGWRFAEVTQVRDVDRRRAGFRVRGRIVVEGSNRFRRNFDRGRFTCFIDGRGRPFIDFDGVRGLR